jgi:hypothetical protein
MKLLFHVGLHRAASTSFQTWIESNREAWGRSRRFIYSDLSSGSQGSVFGALMGNTLASAGPETVAELLEEDLERRATDFDGGLLSDENMLGMIPGQRMRAFAAAQGLTTVFTRLARRHSIVPVVILRDHVSWLVSLYRIAQFRGDVRTFSEFAGQALPGKAGFAPVLARLATAVAPEQPIVATLDAIAGDSGKHFLATVAAALGVDADANSTLPRKNMSPSRLACALRQEVARRGGMFVMEDAIQVQQLIARLSNEPASRNDGNCRVLADIIRRRSVKVEGARRFKGKLKTSADQLQRAPEEIAFLTGRQADDILRDALQSIARPVMAAAEADAIRHRFASDRQWVAERYAPHWNDRL